MAIEEATGQVTGAFGPRDFTENSNINPTDHNKFEGIKMPQPGIEDKSSNDHPNASYSEQDGDSVSRPEPKSSNAASEVYQKVFGTDKRDSNLKPISPKRKSGKGRVGSQETSEDRSELKRYQIKIEKKVNTTIVSSRADETATKQTQMKNMKFIQMPAGRSREQTPLLNGTVNMQTLNSCNTYYNTS
jgi:hypothetical protein